MSMDIDGQPLSQVVFDGKYIIMDTGEEGGGGVSGDVEQGSGARVDAAKKQQSFMEKLIGVRNAQCEMYLATVNRVIDKHAAHNLRAIQAKSNQLKYDYKLMQVSQQQNELAAKQRADPDVDLEYEEFLIRQTQKYLIYNPNNCCYTDKSMRYPPRSGIHPGDSHISPTLAKARKVLHDTSHTKPKTETHHRNVRFHLSKAQDRKEEESISTEETRTSLHSGSNPDSFISPDPDKLFLPTPKPQTEADITMEHFKNRLHTRHMLETIEMAPYKVLLDENKGAKKYPDPAKLKDEDVRLDKTWLPAIYRRSRTTIPPVRTQADPSLLRSRSDMFFHEPVNSVDTHYMGHRSARHSRDTSLSGSYTSEKQSHKNPHSRLSYASRHSAKSALSQPTTTKSTRTIKTRPVTHAMLKREKIELNLKLGTFFNKLDDERKQETKNTKSTELDQEAFNTHSSNQSYLPKQSTRNTDKKLMDKKSTTSGSAQINEATVRPLKASPQATETALPIAMTNGVVQTTPTRPPLVGSSTPRRGIPSHTANRSQRHSATEKLRRVVAALMQNKRKSELLQIAKLRGSEDGGDGTGAMPPLTEATEEQHVLAAS